MTGRYRSKFKQFDEDGNLLCYSCKQYKPLVGMYGSKSDEE